MSYFALLERGYKDAEDWFSADVNPSTSSLHNASQCRGTVTGHSDGILYVQGCACRLHFKMLHLSAYQLLVDSGAFWITTSHTTCGIAIMVGVCKSRNEELLSRENDCWPTGILSSKQTFSWTSNLAHRQNKRTLTLRGSSHNHLFR